MWLPSYYLLMTKIFSSLEQQFSLPHIDNVIWCPSAYIWFSRKENYWRDRIISFEVENQFIAWFVRLSRLVICIWFKLIKQEILFIKFLMKYRNKSYIYKVLFDIKFIFLPFPLLSLVERFPAWVHHCFLADHH